MASYKDGDFYILNHGTINFFRISATVNVINILSPALGPNFSLVQFVSFQSSFVFILSHISCRKNFQNPLC